jgi:hypothetical protein
MHRFVSRVAIGVLLLPLICPGLAAGSPYLLTYDFTGGPAFNPPPFGPSSISPAPLFMVNPTFTAVGTDMGLIVLFGFPLGNTAASQSSFGLGVASQGSVAGGFTEVPPQLYQVDGYDAPTSPFPWNLYDEFFPELLELIFHQSNPGLENPELLEIRLSNFVDPDNAPDLQIYKNGLPLSGAGFNLGTGVITFSTPVPLADGDFFWIFPLVGVSPPFGIHTNSNAFSVSGLTIRGSLTPEPGTLVLLGLGSLGVVGLALRRRKRLAS